MQFLAGIVFAAAIFFAATLATTDLLLFRPSIEQWKAVSNEDDSDRLSAWHAAAAKLGVQIKVGYPVPCVAGADYAARLGYKGIYIERAHADRADELTSEMFTQLAALSR